MLSSSTDFAFFSSPLPPSSSNSPVVVKTRVRLPQHTHAASTPTNSSPTSLLARSLSSPPCSSPLSEPPVSSKKKRRLIDTDPSSPIQPIPRQPKRPRAAPSKEPRKHLSSSSAPSTRAPSRAQSRQSVLAPSPEPIYRSDRSRSTSLFPTTDCVDSPPHQRRWLTDEAGHPGDSFLSSEVIVKRLMKSYKACACLTSPSYMALTRS